MGPVLVFDNRGIGHSVLGKGREGDKYGMEELSNDVVELIKVGPCWGGWGTRSRAN